MNAITWILAGAAMGWLAFTALRINTSRGLIVSAIIGAGSAYFGGSVLAPLFASAPPVAGDFNAFALVLAAAFAAGCIYVSDVVHDRFGV
jgi:uncharacterized membrane protein YeaQ/YmgE (transglycosylase-associated protein family)